VADERRWVRETPENFMNCSARATYPRRQQKPHYVPRHIVLRYAEEHPDEVLAAIDDKTEQVIRDLERQEREAARQFRQRKYTPAELAAVPF
jgi:hypothetical protein